MLGHILDQLADREDLQVVFSPREPGQIELLNGRSWAVPPVPIPHPVPLIELLGEVDWVVTGGGTMLREAAWMGVPAVSVFQGPMPAIDGWLESKGAIHRVIDARDLKRIRWDRPAQSAPIPHHPEALARVVEIVLNGAAAGRARR